MTAPACNRQPLTGTCIERLADGWILATDLCPACTRRFMAALDALDGPLVWHQAYIERATDATNV